MAAKKSGLGKGLDSLITNKVNSQQLNQGISAKKDASDTVLTVKISRVEPNRKQPRRTFHEESLKELAESIRQYGIVQPLIVQDQKSHYEIIAGERRWRAAKLAGLKEVPVIVRESTSLEVMEIALIENIQREDLNPIEEALAYKYLLEEFHLTQEDVAKKVSKSRTAVTNTMRLLKLCEEVRQMVIDGALSSGHARCLLALDDESQQIALAQQILQKGLSVRETEKLIKNLQNQPTAPDGKQDDPNAAVLQAIYKDLEKQMKSVFGTKVDIHQKNNESGKIEITYYSQDDLDRIFQLIKSIQS